VQDNFRYGIVEDGFSTLKRDGWAQGNPEDEFASLGMLKPFLGAYSDSGHRRRAVKSSRPFNVLGGSDTRTFENGTDLHLTLDLEQGTLTTGYQGKEVIILKDIQKKGWRPAVSFYDEDRAQVIKLVHAEWDGDSLVKAAR